MNLSQLPIGERLDALLQQLDENSENESENMDYVQFVDRRAAQDKQQIEEPLSDFEGDRNSGDDLSDFDDPVIDCESIGELGGSQVWDKGHVPIDNKKTAEPESSAPANESNALDQDIINAVYQEAGISPSNTRPTRKSAKQVQKEIENAAREDQHLERSLAAEVTKHTVKTHTAASFLADLDGEDDLQSTTSKPLGNVSHGPSSPAQPDDELIILNDSDSKHTNRPSRAARDMLRFSSAMSTGQRKLIQERQKLAYLQNIQAKERKDKHILALREQGIDLESIEEQITTKQRQNAGGAKAFLDQERKNAAELRKQEYGGDESESESETESVTSNLDILERKKVISDDESDEGEASEEDASDHYPQDINESNDAQVITMATHTDTQRSEDELPQVGRTGTQILAPVSARDLAKMMGASEEAFQTDTSQNEENENENENESQLEQDLSQQELMITGNSDVNEQIVQPNLSDLQDCDDMSSSQRIAEVRERYLQAQAEQRLQQMQRQKRKQNLFVEDQAEESDDEENGLRILGNNEIENDEDAENDNIDLEELIDRSEVNTNSSKLKRRFLEQEMLNDEKLLNKFVDGVNGGFRRKKQAHNQFLFDDDTNYDDPEDAYRLIKAQKREQLIKQNKKIGKLASNEKTAAFFASITEDMVSRPQPQVKSTESIQKGLEFLRQVAGKDSRNARTDIYREESNTSSDSLIDSTSRQPKRPIVVRRVSTIIDRSRAFAKQNTSSSSFTTNIGNNPSKGHHSEIAPHLGRAKISAKPKNRFVAPLATSAGVKPKQMLATNNTRLFKRSWA